MSSQRGHKTEMWPPCHQPPRLPCLSPEEILARERGVMRRTETWRVRLTPGELAAWKAGLAPGESLSSMVRTAVEALLERRCEAQAVEVERRAADPFGFEALLERARSNAVD